MQHDARIRVGALGAGFIGDYHLAELRAVDAEIVAVVGRTAESAARQAARHGIPLARFAVSKG